MAWGRVSWPTEPVDSEESVDMAAGCDAVDDLAVPRESESSTSNIPPPPPIMPPPIPPPDPRRIEAVTETRPSAIVGTRIVPIRRCQSETQKGPRSGIAVRFEFLSAPPPVTVTTNAAGVASAEWLVGGGAKPSRLMVRLGAADSDRGCSDYPTPAKVRSRSINRTIAQVSRSQ